MQDFEKIKFIQDAVLKLFKKNITLKLSDNLLDLGLDSLDIVELQVYYEEVTGLEIDADSTIVTVEDMINLMK